MEIIVENGILKKITGKQDVFVTPKNIHCIAEGAVSSDFEVDTFIIGENVSKIDFGAFCFSTVRKVIFPKEYLPTKNINGTLWNTEVFNYCKNLEEVVLPQIIGEEGSLFFVVLSKKIYVYEHTLSLLRKEVLKNMFYRQFSGFYRGKRLVSGESYLPDIYLFSIESNKALMHLYYKYDLPGIDLTIEYLS